MNRFFLQLTQWYLVPLVLLITFSLDIKAQSTCDNALTLKKVVPTTVASIAGEVHVEVISSGSFEAILYKVSGKGLEMVSRQSGNANETIRFTSLPAHENLSVIVTYGNEEGWCKRRQLSGINILEN